MKKTLFFCLLAVFLFGLAGYARADASVSVTAPSASVDWNNGTTQVISWNPTDPGANPRFNIFAVSTSPAGNYPLATRVAGVNNSFNWKVNVPAGIYKIKVCLLSQPNSVCGESGNITILPPLLTGPQQVLDLFTAAMGNRFRDLNANYNSGVAGVRDYIMSNIGTTEAPSYRITKDMVNNGFIKQGGVIVPKALGKPAIEQLDWFKARFIDLANSSFLNSRDKEGIKYAMVNRYTDICVAEWNAAVNNLTKAYNTALANAERARRGVKAKAATATTASTEATGEELCNFNYNRDLKDPARVPARNSDYNNASQRYLAIEGLNNVKNECINTLYPAFYVARDTALSEFISAKTSGPDARYPLCIGNRISSWSW